MTATNDTPRRGHDSADSTDSEKCRADGGETARRLTIDATDGNLAAVVTITGMGHRTSAEIVDDVEDAIREELGKSVRDDP